MSTLEIVLLVATVLEAVALIVLLLDLRDLSDAKRPDWEIDAEPATSRVGHIALYVYHRRYWDRRYPASTARHRALVGLADPADVEMYAQLRVQAEELRAQLNAETERRAA